MSEETSLTKRTFLLLLAGAGLVIAAPARVFASDDDSGGDDSDGGSDNSGSGSGDDSDDDGGDDDSSNHGGSGNDKHDNDHDNAREAVRKGKAISLSKAMSILKKSESGRVIEVKLVKRSSGFDYRFKVIGSNGRVKTVNMDAANGRIRGYLGF